MAFADGDGYEEWDCSFEDNLFGGHSDKEVRIRGMDGQEIDEFLTLNGAVSGSTLLVMSEAGIYSDYIDVKVDQIILIEDDNPTHKTRFEPDGQLSQAQMSSLRAQKVPTVKARESIEDTEANGRRLAPSLGELKTVVIRIVADGSEPPATELIADDVFGPTTSMKSQYAQCSANKLTVVPVDGSGEATSDNNLSVITVDLGTITSDDPANSQSRDIQPLANQAAKDLFGVTNLNSLFDLVVFVSCDTFRSNALAQRQPIF